MGIDIKTIILIVAALFNAIVLITIKFNDLHHLAKGQTELKLDQKETNAKLVEVSERVSNLEGRLE